jgi:hypothetical protein
VISEDRHLDPTTLAVSATRLLPTNPAPPDEKLQMYIVLCRRYLDPLFAGYRTPPNSSAMRSGRISACRLVCEWLKMLAVGRISMTYETIRQWGLGATKATKRLFRKLLKRNRSDPLN